MKKSRWHRVPIEIEVIPNAELGRVRLQLLEDAIKAIDEICTMKGTTKKDIQKITTETLKALGDK